MANISVISDRSNVLYINLTNMTSKMVKRKDLFNKYIGGVGVATNLMLEEYKEGTDPLDPEAPIVLSTGPMSAMFPTVTKVVAMFRSPLTGELGESYAGGHLAMSLQYGGCHTIVITGRASHPVYLSIMDGEVFFRDASAIMNMSSTTDVGRILRSLEPGAGRRSIVRTGIAGEKGVRYASVDVDTYRHFGRLGLGAVFGSKNLKAMVVCGNKEIEVPDKKAYKKTYSSLFNKIVKTDLVEKYHNLGTSENILPLNALKALPTRNLQQTSFEHAENISGEEFADTYLLRRVSCSGCPIGCIHIAMVRRAFSQSHEYETLKVSYDYELIYALGSNLGVSTAVGVLDLIEKCEDVGVDIISMGVVLAWATEMLEKGLISLDDTLGVELKWGDVDSYLRAIDLVVRSSNEFYSALAQGVVFASKKYGGEDFAIQLGGLEIPGYHTGVGNIVGLSVGVRHSHLDNAGYGADQKALMNKLSDDQIIDRLIEEEDVRAVLNSLTICLFARSIYTHEAVIEALASLGINKTHEDLIKLGKEIMTKRYELKRRFGFDFDDLSVPKRFFETASSNGMIDEERITKAIEMYKAKRVHILETAGLLPGDK